MYFSGTHEHILCERSWPIRIVSMSTECRTGMLPYRRKQYCYETDIAFG
jgi:hypothetical protein